MVTEQGALLGREEKGIRQRKERGESTREETGEAAAVFGAAEILNNN